MDTVDLQQAAAQASVGRSVTWRELDGDLQVSSCTAAEDSVDCGGLAAPSIIDGRIERYAISPWAEKHTDASPAELTRGELSQV